MEFSASVEDRSRRGLQARRQKAMEKAIRQEFYQSDRVKQFHRALLLTETLQDRADQAKVEQKLTAASNEETKKILDEIKRKWLEGIEQDRQNLRKRQLESKAVGDYVRQQIMEHEFMRKQRQLEKEREIQECRRLREKYERDMRLLRQQDQEDKMNVRNTLTELLSKNSTIRALEAQKQEMKDERRRFFEMERDQMVMRKIEKKTERRRVAQKYKEMVIGRLAEEMQDKKCKEEQLSAKVLADTTAKWEAKLDQEQNEKNEKKMAMLKAIAMHREYKRREREEAAKEDRDNAQEDLNARKEEDRIFWETQQLKAQEKEEERSIMDDILRCQMSEKFIQRCLLKEEQMDFDNKYAELIAYEEEQFERYTKDVISAAKEANRNILPLLNTAQKDKWCGVGPISGGMRTNYLVPGANFDKIPDYVSATSPDLKRLYGKIDCEPTARRLNFIW